MKLHISCDIKKYYILYFFEAIYSANMRKKYFQGHATVRRTVQDIIIESIQALPFSHLSKWGKLCPGPGRSFSPFRFSFFLHPVFSLSFFEDILIFVQSRHKARFVRHLVRLSACPVVRLSVCFIFCQFGTNPRLC